MNHGTYPGRVGADAEIRTTQGGTKILSFRIANDIGFGDRRTTQWIDVNYFGKNAESIVGFIRKGDKITVLGEIKLEEFQRRDGTPGAKLALNASHVELGDKKDRGEASGGYERSGSGGGYGGGTPNAGYGSGGGSANKPKPKPIPEFDDDLDDTIPF